MKEFDKDNLKCMLSIWNTIRDMYDFAFYSPLFDTFRYKLNLGEIRKMFSVHYEIIKSNKEDSNLQHANYNLSFHHIK